MHISIYTLLHMPQSTQRLGLGGDSLNHYAGNTIVDTTGLDQLR